MMRPVDSARSDKGLDGILFPGSVPHDFAAFANTLIGLDVRTGGHFLQLDLDWLCAGFTFEGQETGWFGWHGLNVDKIEFQDDKRGCAALHPRRLFASIFISLTGARAKSLPASSRHAAGPTHRSISDAGAQCPCGQGR